jgi:nucleotide-binding universal stress UspA family protein
MPFEKICVAVALQRYIDFTPLALRQREVAMALAKESGGPIWFISVNAPVELLPDLETTEDKLARFVEPVANAGLAAQSILRQGRPSREVASFVRDMECDLLIIGSHSKRGPLDVGLGSTAMALVREVEATVLMLRPTADEQARAGELMIPRYPLVFPYG